MKSIQTIAEMREALESKRAEGAKVGLVPTMGFLHEGHLSLIRQSQQECDVTVVSIFVNPTQFNDPSDYENYPVDLEKDLNALEKEGVQFAFLPHAKEMYPANRLKVQMTIPELTGNLCGLHRPGHFDGVLLVVSKFFNIVQPHRAYFGLKDYQQFLVIRTMARALDFSVEVVGCETVREPDGLAMSSRNARLSEKAREHAALIPRALNLVQKTLQDRKAQYSVKCAELCEIAWDVIESGTQNRVEYMEIVDPDTLQKLDEIQKDRTARIATAVFCDGVRLIDNRPLQF
ncbi:MAG: pantoate--beta-alanine ligase [Spirochaetaceae bacterium]|nr:pantoate--beta-alanine ligase [Spirochaetaceae bacterium]|tara:strand:- start:13179 stop:14045 length:867 start_codon:yes stop_codon:yes gene_type:complete